MYVKTILQRSANFTNTARELILVINMVATKKPTKYIKYDGECLYLRIDGTARNLGRINTRKGSLTRAQKLKAVASTGEWVEA